jgi:4'-phosphopantetheinyl transferase EntD
VVEAEVIEDAAALALRLARAALPAEVSVGACRVGAGEVWDDEAAALPRAVPKRRAEFAAGRTAARAALAGLGLAPVSLPRLPDRLPLWPPGLRGSIAHCDTVAVAAATRAPLSPGIDVEPDAPLPADLVEVVASRRELAVTLPVNVARLVFCAKEAAFKAQFPLTRAWLDFADLTVTLTADGGFTARLNRDAGGAGQAQATRRLARNETITGWWRAAGGLIVAAAALPVGEGAA